MARLWSMGSELNSSAIEVNTASSGAGTSNSSSAQKRSGDYSWLFNISATSTASRTYQFAASNQSAAYYFRTYIYITDYVDVSPYIILKIRGTGTNAINIQMNSTGTLELWNQEDATQIGSDSSALSLNTWYRLEIKVDTTTLASTSVEARLYAASSESTLVWNPSGTVNLANGIAVLEFGFNGISSQTAAFYLDDIALNNSTGSFQNSWPGVGSIVHLRPSGTGDNGDWTGDYTKIDEVTPNDATGSDFITSNTSGQIEDVNIDNTLAAIGTTDTINCVQVGVRFNVADATGGDPSFVLRIKASASGTVEESSNLTSNSTTWTTNAIAAPYNYSLTLYDLPGASTTPWTKADLDTAQIGVRESNTDTHNAQVSTLWLLVDYAPASAVNVTVNAGVQSVAVNQISPTVTPNLTAYTLTDNFDDNSINSVKWTSTIAGSATVAETNQRIQITPANSTVDSNGVLSSKNVLQLHDSCVLVEVPQVADTTNCYTNLELFVSTGNYFGLGISGGNLEAFYFSGGGFNSVTTAAYNSTNHRWWKIKEAGGEIYWEYSADGKTWISFAQITNPLGSTRVTAKLTAYEHTSDATPGAAYFDNFNLGVVGDYVTTLTDNFNDNSLDTSKWTTQLDNSATVTETNQRIEIQCANSTLDSRGRLISKVQYNLTGKRVFVKIPAVGTGSMWSGLWMVCENSFDDNGFLISFDSAANDLSAIEEYGGSATVLAGVTTNLSNQAYVGIRESGGTIYWEYSADGASWTTLYSKTTVIPYTNMYVKFDSHEYASSTGNLAYFDSFNIVDVTVSPAVQTLVSSVPVAPRVIHVGSRSIDTNNNTQDEINAMVTAMTTAVPNLTHIAIGTYMDYGSGSANDQFNKWATAIHNAGKRMYVRSAGFNDWLGSNNVPLFVTQTNYVVNPYFESNTNYWATGGSMSISRVTTEHYERAASMQISATTADDRTWTTFADAGTAVVGHTYTFSCWLKGSGTVRLWVWDGDSDEYSSNITLTGTWTQYTKQVTCAATGMLAGIRLPTTNTVTGYVDKAFWVDDATTPTTFTNHSITNYSTWIDNNYSNFVKGDYFEPLPDEPENCPNWDTVHGGLGASPGITAFNSFITDSITSANTAFKSHNVYGVITNFVFTNPSATKDVITQTTANLLIEDCTDDYPETSDTTPAQMQTSMESEITNYINNAHSGNYKHLTFGPSVYLQLSEADQKDALYREFASIRDQVTKINGITLWQLGATDNSPKSRLFDYTAGNWVARSATSTLNKLFQAVVKISESLAQGVQSVTVNQLSPTVTISGGTTVSPSVQSVAVNLISPTITTTKNVTVSPSVQSKTLSQQSIQITVGDGVSAGVQSSTFSAISPTVTAVKNKTVSPSVQSVIVNQISSTVSAVKNATPSPNVQSGTLNQINPSVSTTKSVTVSPDIQTITASQISPAVQQGGTEVYASSLYTDPDLLSYYQLEGDSTDSIDSRDGTDTNITYGTGKFNQGSAFAGNSGINIGNDVFTNVQLDAGSISLWVKRNGNPASTEALVDLEGWVTISINSSGNIVFWTGTPFSTDTGSGTVTDNEWHSVILTWNGTTASLYIDGTLDKTNNNASPDLESTARPNEIGKQAGQLAKYFTGSMDDIAFFSRVLTADEIAELNATNTSTNASVNAGVQSVTASQPSLTVTATKNISVSPNVQSGVLSQPSPTVTAIKSKTVTPNVQSLVSSQGSPTLTVGDGVTPAVLSGTLNQIGPTVTAVKNKTVSPAVQSGVFSAISPSIRISDSVTPSELNATFNVINPTVSAGTGKTVSPSVQSGTFNLISPQILANTLSASVTPDVLSGVLSQPTPTITAEKSVTVYPQCLTVGAPTLIYNEKMRPMYRIARDLWLTL